MPRGGTSIQNSKGKMAMEKQAVIKETHHRSVTAIGYHPMRREILAGFEGNFVVRKLAMCV